MTVVSVPKNVWTSVVTASADTIVENRGHPEVFVSTSGSYTNPEKLKITTIKSGDTAYIYSVNRDTTVVYYQLGGSGSGVGVAETFETVNNNLDASDATLTYTGSDLTSVVYANGITKTLAYSGGGLSTVTLSGSTPGGIDLVKTFTYSGGNLTAVTYS